MSNAVTIQQAVDMLSDMVTGDRAAMAALIDTVVPCDSTNRWFANHRTVQVRRVGGQDYIGLLGVLNGLFCTHPEGECIQAAYDDTSELQGFQVGPIK